jgi:hypothetical protein
MSFYIIGDGAVWFKTADDFDRFAGALKARRDVQRTHDLPCEAYGLTAYGLKCRVASAEEWAELEAEIDNRAIRMDL